MFVSFRIILFSLLVINAAKSIQAGAEGSNSYKNKDYNLMIVALESLDIASPLTIGQENRVQKYQKYYDQNTGKVENNAWGKILGPYEGKESYGYKDAIQKLGKDLEANKNRISAAKNVKMQRLSNQVVEGRTDSNRAHGGGDRGHIGAVNFMTEMNTVLKRIDLSRPRLDLSPSLPKSGGTIANFQRVGSSSSNFEASKTRPGASWSSVAALNQNSVPSGSQLKSVSPLRPVKSETTQRTTTRKTAIRNTTPYRKRS